MVIHCKQIEVKVSNVQWVEKSSAVGERIKLSNHVSNMTMHFLMFMLIIF
jgi:hypothetical protein